MWKDAPEELKARVGEALERPVFFSVADDSEGIVFGADGAVVVEDLLARNDDAMTYSYAVTAGLPLAEHTASFTVEPNDDGCRVIWRTHAVHEDPSIDMEARLADRQREALEGLRAVLEAGPA